MRKPLRVINQEHKEVELPQEIAEKLLAVAHKFSEGSRTETEFYYAGDGEKFFTICRTLTITVKDM